MDLHSNIVETVLLPSLHGGLPVLPCLKSFDLAPLDTIPSLLLPYRSFSLSLSPAFIGRAHTAPST